MLSSNLASIATRSSSVSSKALLRCMTTMTNDVRRVVALCKANSEVLSRNIKVIENLIDRTSVAGANEIYTHLCPITGTTLGRQFRHELDHFERVALDGIHTVRDSKEHKPIDLHYDVRERGTVMEHDICEARDKALFIRDVFDGVATECKEHTDECSHDGQKRLTANFTLPGENVDFVEFPLASTLEREMGFVCHHAIHHNKVIKAMAVAGYTGLLVDDLPADFGTAPTTLVKDAEGYGKAA